MEIIWFAVLFCLPLILWPCPPDCCDVDVPTCSVCTHMEGTFQVTIAGVANNICLTCTNANASHTTTRTGNSCSHGNLGCLWTKSFTGCAIGSVVNICIGTGKISVTLSMIDTLQTYAAIFEKAYPGGVDCSEFAAESIPLISEAGSACTNPSNPTCTITAV